MMKYQTLGIRIQVSLEDVESLLYSAAEGSKYWAASEKLGYESVVKDILKPKEEGTNIAIEDLEEGKSTLYLLNLEKLKKGLTVMAKKERKHFCDLINDEADMITADVFLQCCLFNEVKYS